MSAPTPVTLSPTASTLVPTLSPATSTLSPTPTTLSPTLSTLSLKPTTLPPTSLTASPTPTTLPPTLSTLSPTPTTWPPTLSIFEPVLTNSPCICSCLFNSLSMLVLITLFMPWTSCQRFCSIADIIVLVDFIADTKSVLSNVGMGIWFVLSVSSVFITSATQREPS